MGPSPYHLDRTISEFGYVPGQKVTRNKKTHWVEVVLEEWRFDWQPIKFPWGTLNNYSLCYVPPHLKDAYDEWTYFEHEGPIEEFVEDKWKVVETWTLESFGKIFQNLFLNRILNLNFTFIKFRNLG